MAIRSNLIKRLDTVFSTYVRLSKADDNGYCKCISCDNINHWKDMDAGHYINRKHMSTRWDVDNVSPQCHSCNRFLSGNIPEYLEAIGHDLGQHLVRRKYIITKYSDSDLEELLDTYKRLLEPYKHLR